ncbi:MAG: right-handed parallel beta-helix repeat-containing protein [Planctomycetes bacterium]|nr:right-handed parallel beta-helix repeat-containing protein [Planctomycetota bacterium]
MLRQLFLAAAAMPFASILSAQTVLHVPSQYPTVQAALDAAQAADVVLVAPGNYAGPIVFPGRDVVLRGAGPERTVLSTTTFDPVITCLPGSSRQAVIEGFTIRGGNGFDAGGIYVNQCSPTIRGNHVVQNRTSARGGGIGVYFGGPLIADNLIAGNTQSIGQVSGGGISLLGAGASQIVGNRIRDNAALTGGGIACNNAGSPRIVGNRISGNTASYGGGLSFANSGDYRVVQNLIEGNVASRGGGIDYTNGTLTLVHNTIVGNSGLGAAMHAYRPPAVITMVDNIMVGAPVLLFGDLWRPEITHVFSHNVLFGPTVYGGAWPDGGTNNGTILADPLLRADGVQISWESPARNHGVPHPEALATDLFGDPRTLGDEVDIGADEYSGTFEFGNACHGVLSAPVLRPIGQPLSGNTGFAFDLRGGVPGGAALFGIGDSVTTWLGEPLPRGLERYGLPGCLQLVSGLYSTMIDTDASGAAAIACPVPMDPGLVGVLLHAQWGALATPIGTFGPLDGVSGGLSFEVR